MEFLLSVKILPEDQDFEHITICRVLEATTNSFITVFLGGVLIKNQFEKQEESVPSLKYCSSDRSLLAGSHPNVVWHVRFRVN